MLVGFTFQSLGKETTGEVAVGFIERGGGQAFGLILVQVHGARNFARSATDYRLVRSLLRVGAYD
jgi:hypothetical protein